MCGISTYKQVKFLGKILQHCCGKFFFAQVAWKGGQWVQGGHCIMVFEYEYGHGYEKRKDYRTDSQHIGGIQIYGGHPNVQGHMNVWGIQTPPSLIPPMPASNLCIDASNWVSRLPGGHVCEAGNTFQPAATSAPIKPLCIYSRSNNKLLKSKFGSIYYCMVDMSIC